MGRQIIIKNLLISYEEFGAAHSGRAVVFLHGWRSNKEIWLGVIKDLQLTTYNLQLIALDLPGFGQSQISPRPMTVGDYAEVAAEFIKKMALKNVIVVGHSFGGRVGIKLSSVNPELVSRLVLVDSAGFSINESKKNLTAFAAKIVKPIFKPKIMQGLRKKIYQKIGAEDYVATPELRQTLVSITSEDLSADMKKIVCPALILNGENDADTPISFGKKMNSLIRNSQFAILPNAGHFSFLDQPEEFVEILKNFIK